MNEIVLYTNELPIVYYADKCIATSPFIHTDRIADFHVLIYVIRGQITVTEEANGVETNYEINADELLFLKQGTHHYGKKEQSGILFIFIRHVTGRIKKKRKSIRAIYQSWIWSIQ